ncbi:hypothetical protein NPIL_131671 [Nephila pilipes]|uniref:Uncharacterized protein n=1 Tax=Nephila pilipes TaxID=299642 RepID=A0A8X6UIA2_NEPPI|nr:hypothetical protein NPIL_131671 [Nephila pilipes]
MPFRTPVPTDSSHRKYYHFLNMRSDMRRTRRMTIPPCLFTYLIEDYCADAISKEEKSFLLHNFQMELSEDVELAVQIAQTLEK